MMTSNVRLEVEMTGSRVRNACCKQPTVVTRTLIDSVGHNGISYEQIPRIKLQDFLNATRISSYLSNSVEQRSLKSERQSQGKFIKTVLAFR